MIVAQTDMHQIRRIATTTDWLMITGADIKRCIREGYDTMDIARAYCVRESTVWNRMAADGC